MAWTERTGRTRSFNYKATMRVRLPAPEYKVFPAANLYRVETSWWWVHPTIGTLYKLTMAFYFSQSLVGDNWSYRVIIGLQNPPYDGTNWAGEHYDVTTNGEGEFGAKSLTFEVTIPVEEFVTFTADGVNSSRYFGEAPRITGQLWEAPTSRYMQITAPVSQQLDLGVGVIGLRLGFRAYFDHFYCETEIDHDGYTQYHQLMIGRAMEWSGIEAGGVPYLFRDARTAPLRVRWGDAYGAGLFLYNSTASSIRVSILHVEHVRAGETNHYSLADFAGPELWADAPYQFHLDGDAWNFANGVPYPGVVEAWLVVGYKYAYGGDQGGGPVEWPPSIAAPFGYAMKYLSDGAGHFDVTTLAMFSVSWAAGGFPGWTELFMDSRTPNPDVPDGGWLYQHKERRADFGIAIDEFAFSSFTIDHVDTLAVEAMDDFTDWTAGANTVLADGGGGDAGSVEATIAGGAGSFFQVYAAGARSFQQFRHLRFRARADSAASVRVKITFDDKFHPTDTDYWGARTSHYWDVDLTDAYADYDLDLCIPHDRAAEDTMNGIDGSVTRISFESLEDGRVYYVADLSLVTLGTSPSKYHLRADWAGQGEVAPEPPDRSVFRLHDGKRALDGRKALSMADLVAHLADETLQGGGSPFGCTVTDLAPASPGGYYQNDVGGPDDWTGREVRELFHVAENGTLTVERRCRIDLLYPYPGAGDFALRGAFGAIVLRFDKPLRAETQGILAENLTDDPAAGIVITVEEQDGSTASDVGGHFETVPTRDEQVDRTVTLEEAGVDWEYRPHSRRLTLRNSEAEVLGAGNSDLDVSRDSRVYQVWSDETTISIRSRGGADPGWRRYTVTAGDFPSVYVDDLTADDYVFLAFESGGNVPLWRSADSGETWALAVTLFTGCTKPHIRKDKAMDLCLAFAWEDVDGGTIKMRRSDDDWASFLEAEYAIIAGIPEQTVACSFAGDEDHEFLLSYVDAGGAIGLLRSVDNGLSWSVV